MNVGFMGSGTWEPPWQRTCSAPASCLVPRSFLSHSEPVSPSALLRVGATRICSASRERRGRSE
jgi:hypothetical protein